MSIYFIQAGENGPIKIGYTDGDAHSRMAQLQTGNHEKLNLLWVYDGVIYKEKEIQDWFHSDRIIGEWFRPVKGIFNAIENELGNTYVPELILKDITIFESLSEICISIHDIPGALIDIRILSDGDIICHTEKGFKDFVIKKNGDIQGFDSKVYFNLFSDK